MRKGQSIEHRGQVGQSERLLTSIVGVGLLAIAWRLPSVRKPLGVVSAALLARAASGYCPAYAAAEATADGFAAPSNHAATVPAARVSASVTIAQPREVVFAFWRDLDRLALALPNSLDVRALDEVRSRWTLLPVGADTPVARWVAEIVNEDPGRLIAWKTTAEADVVGAGSVRFADAPGTQGTEVRVVLQYAPPFGRLGAAVAALFGTGADAVVRQYLRDIKRHLELGRHVTLAS